MHYRNPVIPGFFPDPSVCRVGDTYYLVCSSFQFFPGVPLFESRDLINWKQIGHVLTRASQLPLDRANSVGGIYAPTIRCHNGRFYMVTTNVTVGRHFYVWTDDIHGEWSEPIWVDQEGIDPSLFFEDGKAYFMSNGTDANGKSAILQSEIDIATGERLTETVPIWGGAGGRFLESPHLYHIGEYYYLMASEGGTEYGHMVVLARGKTPYGPFEGCPHNPVLTNRNEGGYLLQGCGHGDLVDDPDGNWWMVHLGFRQIHRWMMFHTTGREVNLVPVTFDADGWFTAGDNGVTRLEMQTDRIPETVVQQPAPARSFANTAPGREWVFLQNPQSARYQLAEDRFSLTASPVTLDDGTASPTWIGLRQTEMQFTFSVRLSLAGDLPAEAGVTVYMGGQQHYDLFVRTLSDGRRQLVRRAVLGSIVQEQTAALADGSDAITLTVTGEPVCYGFSGGDNDMGKLESKFLSTEVAGNFTGVMLGLFAVGDSGKADFTDFEMESSRTE